MPPMRDTSNSLLRLSPLHMHTPPLYVRYDDSSLPPPFARSCVICRCFPLCRYITLACYALRDATSFQKHCLFFMSLSCAESSVFLSLRLASPLWCILGSAQGASKRLYVIGTHASRQSALDEAEDVVRYKLTGQSAPGRGKEISRQRQEASGPPDDRRGPPPRYDDRRSPPRYDERPPPPQRYDDRRYDDRRYDDRGPPPQRYDDRRYDDRGPPQPRYEDRAPPRCAPPMGPIERVLTEPIERVLTESASRTVHRRRAAVRRARPAAAALR